MRFQTISMFAAVLLGIGTSLHANTTLFGLLNDPNQNYTFTPTGTTTSITEPAGPYPGYIGADIPGDLGAYFCIDYRLTANWNTSYTGTVYHIGSAIPGTTLQQQLEAGYLSDQLVQLGGSSANTNLYQGPISFAIWQILDPTPGDVPVAAAAQPWILLAQNMYNTHMLNPASYSNTVIFVPVNTSIQSFMSLSAATPEPQTVELFGLGALLIGLGLIRPRRT